MTIQVTERAAEHIRDALSRHGSGIGLRLGVRTSGCSGFMYTVDQLPLNHLRQTYAHA
jgi:iron-sulfur cluster assembly protein